jgi:hypothetical protein
MQDSFTPFYYLNGSERRTPGNNDPFDKDGNLLGETFEFVHPVVGFRAKQIKDYTPIGRDVKFARRKVVDKNGRPAYVYDLGSARQPLPEWRLGGVDSYERLAITSKAAYDYVDELDLELKTGIKTIRRSVYGVRDIDLGIEVPHTGQEEDLELEQSQRGSTQSTGFGTKEMLLRSSDVSYGGEAVTAV